MKDRDMSGILFKNDKKTTAKQPDFTGNATIGGVKYRLSAWKKQGQKGTFLSIAVSDFTGTHKPEPEAKDDFGI